MGEWHESKITGYLLIPTTMANMYLWRQESFWSTKVDRVRRWDDNKFSFEVIVGMGVSVCLTAWGAIEEIFNFI